MFSSILLILFDVPIYRKLLESENPVIARY